MSYRTNRFAPPSALGLAAILGLSLFGPGQAQPQRPATRETVTWSVASPSPPTVKPGGRVAVSLRGDVLSGWHVYGFKQLPTGPTSLQVTLDANAVAKADGAANGSPPLKVLDKAFNVVTPYYDKAFTLTAPVRIGSKVAPGVQAIPVNVRFQTCNNEVCQPPKTVRLSVPVNVVG